MVVILHLETCNDHTKTIECFLSLMLIYQTTCDDILLFCIISAACLIMLLLDLLSCFGCSVINITAAKVSL